MELGRTGRDVITGFQGVITGECRYLTGCTQVVLVDKVDKDSKARDKWFDVSRVEYVGDDVVQLVSPINTQDDKVGEDLGPSAPSVLEAGRALDTEIARGREVDRAASEPIGGPSLLSAPPSE